MISPARRRGRPPCCPCELAARIARLHFQRGLSLRQISQMLNDEGIPTPMGQSLWRKSHVDRVLHTQYVRDIIESSAWGQLGPALSPLSAPVANRHIYLLPPTELPAARNTAAHADRRRTWGCTARLHQQYATTGVR